MTTASARPGPTWFWDRIREGGYLADAIAEVGDTELAGAAVAHIGSGDGIATVELCDRGAATVTAFDEDQTDLIALRAVAIEAGRAVPAAPIVDFRPIHNGGLPAESGSFDIAVVSMLARARTPAQLMGEVRRILRPTGVAIIVARPLFRSAEGSQVPGVFAPHEHLLLSTDDAVERILSSVDNRSHAAALVDRFTRLNRLTVEEIQQVVVAGGLRVDVVALEQAVTPVVPRLQHVSVADLATVGVRLAARPWAPREGG